MLDLSSVERYPYCYISLILTISNYISRILNLVKQYLTRFTPLYLCTLRFLWRIIGSSIIWWVEYTSTERKKEIIDILTRICAAYQIYYKNWYIFKFCIFHFQYRFKICHFTSGESSFFTLSVNICLFIFLFIYLCKLVCTNCLTTAADGIHKDVAQAFRLLKLRGEFFNSFLEHALIELIFFNTYFFSTFRYFSLYFPWYFSLYTFPCKHSVCPKLLARVGAA